MTTETPKPTTTPAAKPGSTEQMRHWIDIVKHLFTPKQPR